MRRTGDGRPSSVDAKRGPDHHDEVDDERRDEDHRSKIQPEPDSVAIHWRPPVWVGGTLPHPPRIDKASRKEAAMRLQGKIALITGAQQGIGRAVALAFAREGADVGINYLDDRSAAERLAQEIRAVGRRSVLVPGDVARSTTGQELVAPLVRELGGVDVLVNNAGVYPRVPFLEMRERDWDLVLDVNLKGGFFCAQAAARAMIAGGRQGSIINLASQAIRGAVRGVHYSASKGGVVAMTRAMALELAPHRIRVNAIAPGLTDTAQPR